jgi:SAM-dependent methyltransferase/Flp pilus assembly protein TadD
MPWRSERARRERRGAVTGTAFVTGRNDPCPCGSGRKYKHCCLARDTARDHRVDVPRALNDAAMAHQRAGRYGDAAAAYRRALAVAPRSAELHFNLGTALQAQGDVAEAIAAYRRALALDERLAVAHHNLANLLRGRGELDAALAHYRRAVALRPDSVPARVDLAQLLQSVGDADGAVACYEAALALAPQHAALHGALALALEDAGRHDDALAAHLRALEIEDTAPLRANFARCVARATRVRDEPKLIALIARALREAWTRPNDLSRIASATLARHRLDDPATEPLLLALLANGRVCDVSLEHALTDARRTLLAHACTDAPAGPTPLDCALAEQCDANEHVFAVAPDEAAQARSLRERLLGAVRQHGRVAAAWIVAVGGYYALGEVAGVESLLGDSWPAAMAALLARWRSATIDRRERATIAALTPIDDPVSQDVHAQYEDNPYPRWSSVAPTIRTCTLDEYLRGLFPLATFARLAPRPNVLVAGCGTGQETIELASLVPSAHVTAIDLSRASLAYAQRKTREAGLRNVDYAQADILQLPSIGRSFDAISAVGVLHHLADPAAGLRALATMLGKGGVMRLGFYSERGRADVAAARAFIAEQGFDASPDGIRHCRQAMIARGGALEPIFDRIGFYSTSECRDLLFHVQEHRLTLAKIESMLEANRLRLLGFLLDASVLAGYTRRFPDDPARTRFAHWDTLEAEQPALFAGMYRFWVQRAA